MDKNIGVVGIAHAERETPSGEPLRNPVIVDPKGQVASLHLGTGDGASGLDDGLKLGEVPHP